MKEVSPQAIWIAMFLIIAASSILTLLGSILIIVLYRRGVLRAMNQKTFEKADTAQDPRPDAVPGRSDSGAPQVAGAEAARDDAPRSVDADALYRRAAGAPWQAALHTATAGLAFALVLAAAYCLAVPAARTLPRFALTLWWTPGRSSWRRHSPRLDLHAGQESPARPISRRSRSARCSWR